MGRFYSINVAGVAVSAAQDLFEILAGSGKPFYLHEIVVGQTSDFGDAAAEGLGVRIKRATSGYTSGSGGSTPTPAKHLTSDSASGVTAEANNTTQAVAGGGTLTTLRAEPFNVQAGYQYLPTPETRYFFAAGEACVISLTAPADAITVDMTAVIEELG
jgi:hypothetical protein